MSSPEPVAQAESGSVDTLRVTGGMRGFSTVSDEVHGERRCTVLTATHWPSDELGFARLLENHEPVVFKGLATGWLGCQSPADVLALLCSMGGDRVLAVTGLLPGDHGLILSGGRRSGSVDRPSLIGFRTLRDVAKEMERELKTPSGHPLYMTSINLSQDLPELMAFARLPLEGCPALTGEWKAWIGTGDHRVALHMDGAENFFCLLHGSKRFTLFPHRVLHDIYIGPLDGGQHGVPTSMVDVEQPDLRAYPRFEKARGEGLIAELDAGDVLYLPCHWWHAVKSSGLNVALNYWWKDVSESRRLEAEAVFYRALLALRTLPDHWREYWSTTFNEFVFQRQGDPYQHLQEDAQGFAGAPTADRLNELRQKVEHAEGQVRRAIEVDDQWNRRAYQLSPDAYLKLATSSVGIGRLHSQQPEYRAPLAMLAVLASFSQPSKPADVIEEMRTQGVPDLDDLEKRLRYFVGERLLVRCD
jgi:hypothetical protein